MTRAWFAVLFSMACGHTTTLAAQLAIIDPMVAEKAARCPDSAVEIKRSEAPGVIIATMPPTTEYNWVLRTCGEESRVILDCSPRGSRTVCLAQSDLPASTTNDVGSANRGEKCAAPTGTLLVPQVSTPAWEDHRCALSEEIASQGAISAAWERLNPAHRNTAWFAAVEELKQERAVWSLAALLDHPSEDVGIVSARALTELGDRRAVGPLLAKARRLAVYKGESETTTIHAIFQHVVANALKRVTGAGVRLHDGQDPSGLLAGIEIWSAANR